MFERNQLEEWYEGKKPEYNISECGMVATTGLDYLSKKIASLSIFEYGDSSGEGPLVDAISKIYQCDRKNVLITNGASEALFIALLALCDKCLRVLCQFPHYNYSGISHFLKKIGCELRRFDLSANSHFSFDFELFKRTFDGSDVAILNFPNNPTGVELSECDYINILNYLDGTHKKVVFDEVTVLPLSRTFVEKNICNHLDNCICINSMSKAYGVPGIRVGWIIANEKTIKECQAIKELISICTSPMLQDIAYNILRERDSIITKNRKIILKNIESLTRHINQCNMPFLINSISSNCSCCFIKIPDTVEDYNFCLRVYKSCDVLLTPSACFGIEGYIRLGLGVNPIYFDAAMERVRNYVNEHYNPNSSIL